MKFYCVYYKPVRLLQANPCYHYIHLPLLSAVLSLFSSRFSRASWSGPWAKEYTASVTWSLTSRLPRPLDGHFLTHSELGLLALHTITWQWTNTNGWSAMNLKASKLNRWALTEDEEWYLTVTSLGHLKENNNWLIYFYLTVAQI